MAITRTQAKAIGSKGGKATVEKYGREYMKELAKRGAAALWKKYRKVPIRQAEYALVNRETNEIVRILNG